MAQIFKAKTLVSSTGRFSYEATAPNLVYNTGDQIISGNKFFVDNINVSGSGIFNALDLNNIDTLTISGVDINIINGEVSLTNRPTVNGTGVLLSGEVVNFSLPNTIVYTTGDQNVSGIKNFYSRPTVNGTGVLLSGEAASLPTTIVYTTGDQTISGLKDFTTRPTVSTTPVLLSGDAIISGDLTGYLPHPTINKLQGYKVDLSATPAAGQVLEWNGTSWAAGTIPAGGNGGGGLVYYFDFANRSGIAPTGGLPTTGDHALSLLGIEYSVGSGQATSNELDPRFVERLLCSFVTASGNPQVTNIPAGLWDFNIWASVDSASAIQCSIRAVVNIYNPTNSTYRYLASTDDVYLYETDTIAQYILNATVPQTGIANNERIYIQFFGKKYTTNNRRITLYFDSYRPSHVHTTIPSVAGNGVVKVVNGVFQSPATGIFDNDVDNNANINQSKIANLSSDLNDIRSTGIALNNKINNLSGYVDYQDTAISNNLALTGSTLQNNINNLSGYINSTGSNIVFTTGNQNISGQKRFVDQDIVSTVTFNSLNQPSTFFAGFSGPGVFRFEVKPEYRPVVFPNPNYFYTGVNPGQPVEIYFNTGTSRWWYTVNNSFVDASPIVQASSSSAPLPLNNWSGGNMRIYPTYSHNISHYTDGNDPIDVDRINGVAKIGDQNISGIKNFYSRLTVNGTGVLLSGEAAQVDLSTTVRTTGNQTVSGIKSFEDSIKTKSIIAADQENLLISGYSSSMFGTDINITPGKSSFSLGKINLTAAGDQVDGNINFKGNIDINNYSSLYPSGLGHSFKIYKSGLNEYSQRVSIKSFEVNQTGVYTLNKTPIYSDGQIYISGNPILTGIDLSSYATTANLALTGSTLNTKINNLSGYINSPNSNIVFTTGDQSISGNKTFNNNVIVTGTAIFNQIDLSDTDNILLSGVNIQIVSGSITLTNMPTISGKPLITGVDLSSYLTSAAASSTYATITNLAGTGSTLATNLASTGSTLSTNLASTGSTLSTNLNTTGSTLSNKIDSLSGSSVLLYGNQSIGGVKTFRDNVYINNLYVTGTETIVNTSQINLASNYLLLNITGGAVDGGIFFVTGSGLTGVNDTGPIIGFDHSTKFKFGFSTRNSDLSTLPDIASVQDIQAYSGVADNKFATITNLILTGSNLNTKIDNLSGYINSTGSNIVFTTGNQTINGIKTFNTPNVSGYLNFTTGSYISGLLNPRNNLTFSRDNSVTTGAAVSFIKTGNLYDAFDGIALTRGSIGPLYNYYSTTYFGNDSTNPDYINPRNTKWNLDGWSDLSNIRSRKYDNFVDIFQNQIGNYIVDAELVMWNLVSNNYYLMKFSSWQGGGGGNFSYVRSLVSFNDPEISKISGYLGVAQNAAFDSSVTFNSPTLFKGSNDYYSSNRYHGYSYFQAPTYFKSDIVATGNSFIVNMNDSSVNSNYVNIKTQNDRISLNDGFDKNLDQFLYSITLTGAGIAEANGVWTRPSGGNTPFTNGQTSSNLYWGGEDDQAWYLQVYSADQDDTQIWYVTYGKTFSSHPWYQYNNSTVPTTTNRTWRSKNINGTNILANIGEVVLLTGNQTISGIKSFADNTVFGDPSQDNFLVISGNNFTVYGSGNFTSGLFVNGTGVLLSGQATQVDLGSTVRTTGNQTVSGVKNFQSVPLVSGKEVYFQKDIVYASGISFTPNYVSGRNFVYQLTGFATTYNTINNPINIPEGETIIIKVIQSNYGNNFLNFGNNYRFPADASPLITQASGKFDIFNILKLDNRFITTYIKNFSN